METHCVAEYIRESRMCILHCVYSRQNGIHLLHKSDFHSVTSCHLEFKWGLLVYIYAGVHSHKAIHSQLHREHRRLSE